MVLILDSRLPLVWRSPSSLQLGVDAPRVVLTEVSEAQERMISAMISGISRSGLGMVASAAGASEDDADALLAAVGPALETEREPPLGSVTVIGSGATADGIRSTLSAIGASLDPREPPSLAILVAHYVIEPEDYGLWLRRDVPHLPVVFGDAEVRIGPLVEPGGGPCLHCLERYRTDADPAWPAIASQLWGRRSAAEGELVSLEVVALASRLAQARLRGSRDAASESLHLDVGSGRLSRKQWLPHPDCACLALPGNDSADAPRVLSVHPPRRAAAAAALS